MARSGAPIWSASNLARAKISASRRGGSLRDEAEQKDALALYRHLSKDRGALLTFFDEARDLVEELKAHGSPDAALQRSLHTLKGNAAMFDLLTLAGCCHSAEDAIAEDCFEIAHLQAVVTRFEALQATLASIAGDNTGERVDIPRATLRALAQRLSAGLPAPEAARAVEQLLLEPIKPSLERLAEHARVLASRLDKPEPRVEIVDGGLLVDAKRAAPLFAALVHLIRNAVDHGLESRPERIASHKQDAILSLRASLENGEARIEIQDNGRGVDWERVRERARERGLPASSNSDLAAALFSAEFSTRHTATTTSGRGVGLAAVQAEAQRLSGRVLVESELGRGTLFTVVVAADALGLAPDCRVEQPQAAAAG
jgi:two-component system chemotaxis sensor kinase CheA